MNSLNNVIVNTQTEIQKYTSENIVALKNIWHGTRAKSTMDTTHNIFDPFTSLIVLMMYAKANDNRIA